MCMRRGPRSVVELLNARPAKNTRGVVGTTHRLLEALPVQGRYDPRIMTEDDAPKSSLELAMARLRKKDAESGDSIRELSGEQKEEIAEIRRVYDAKLAEVDIMKKPKLPPGLPEELREQVDLLNEQYMRERDILSAERDAKIEAVRSRTPEA